MMLMPNGLSCAVIGPHKCLTNAYTPRRTANPAPSQRPALVHTCHWLVTMPPVSPLFSLYAHLQQQQQQQEMQVHVGIYLGTAPVDCTLQHAAAPK